MWLDRVALNFLLSDQGIEYDNNLPRFNDGTFVSTGSLTLVFPFAESLLFNSATFGFASDAFFVGFAAVGEVDLVPY